METGTNLKLQIKIFESAFWIFEVLCINYHKRSVLQSKLLLWFISIFQEVLRWKDEDVPAHSLLHSISLHCQVQVRKPISTPFLKHLATDVWHSVRNCTPLIFNGF